MAITNKVRRVPREYGRNNRIIGGSSSTSSTSSSGSSSSSSSSSVFGEYFEIINPNEDNQYIRAKFTLASVGNMIAYEAGDTDIDSIWDSLPIASDTVLGGVKIGANLSIDSEGVLSAQAGGSGVSSWNDLTDKPTEFNPTSHTHVISEVIGLQSELDSKANISGSGTQDFSAKNISAVNLTLSGKITEVETEIVKSENDFIFTRVGATTGLISGTYTGIQASLYDGANDGQLVFGSDGLARVGDVGDLQILATREDSPISNGIAYYDSVNKRFNTKTESSMSVGYSDNSNKLDGYDASSFLQVTDFNDLFELTTVSGEQVIRAKYTVASDGNVIGFADFGGTLPSIFDNLPVATSSSKGILQVNTGNGLTISSGVLDIDPAVLDPTLSFSGNTLNVNGSSVDLSSLAVDLTGYATESWANNRFSLTTHNHDSDYLSITGKASDSGKLDGIDSTQFLRSDVDDTMTGDLTIYNDSYSTTERKLIFDSNLGAQGAFVRHEAVDSKILSPTGAALIVGSLDGETKIHLEVDGDIYSGGNEVWHSGNDGSGSGLDADTLDGVDGANYLRSNINDTTIGVLICGSNSFTPLVINRDSNLVNVNIAFQNRGENTHYLGMGSDLSLRWGTDGDATANGKVWHSGNDGSDSGLDADMLDGYHASSFPRKAENAIITGSWSFDYNFSQKTGGLNFGTDGINEGVSFYSGSGISARVYRDNNILYIGARGGTHIDGLVVNESGMVGVKKEPTETLDVSGNIKTSSKLKISSQWSIGFSGTDLIFYNSSDTKVAKIDQSGNLTSSGNITAFGTV